jgi:hypothetical protein
MKKLIVSTRFYAETWFQKTFIRYYQAKGACQIRVYCTLEDEALLADMLGDWMQSGLVILLSKPDLRVISYGKDLEISRMIYQETLEAISTQVLQGKSFVLAFPDHDEFISFPADMLQEHYPISFFRSVFFEWYLALDSNAQTYDSEDMLLAAQKGDLRGKMLDVWGDPHYKDYIFSVNPNNFQFYVQAAPTGGFHRLISANAVWIPDDYEVTHVDHLKGMPFEKLKHILFERCLMAGDLEDDWIAFHYHQEFQSLVKDYSNTYQALATFPELQEEAYKRLNSYRPAESTFDNVVVRQNLDCVNFSRPSLFDLKIIRSTLSRNHS